MALEYFKYITTYGNTLVDRSNSSFAPVPPYGQIYIDYFIPQTQPLYLYANSGGTGGTIVVNTQVNINNYLNATELPPTADGNVTYGQYTASTTQTNQNVATISATTNNKLNTSIFQAYTGITAPLTFASKVNAITGATNLGTATPIYTSVSGNKIGLKSLSGGSGISISNTANAITICSTTSGSGITGATNGLCRYNTQNVCLGGALTNHTTINSGNFIYCIAGTQSSYYQNNSSVCLSMNGASAHQLRVSGCGASVESCCSKLLVYSGGTTFTSGAVSDCAGIKYAADYSGTYTTRSLVDKGYVTGITTTLLPKSIYQTYTGTTVPNTYYNKTQINSYTASTLTNINSRLLTATFNTWSGTTLPNTYLKKTTFATYTGTTAPNQFASKTNAITGATNLGTGNGTIFTTVSGNKINLKTLSGGTNVTLTCNGNYIAINASYVDTGILWTGSTANGVATYASATKACSNPNMTFNGSSLSVTGNILASTYMCSPIISGSTRVCSPIVCGTSCVSTALLCSTGQVKGTILTGSTCVTSPTVRAGTCLCSIGTTKLVGATTGSTLYLTTTPPASSIQCPTLFYDTTTKQIQAKQLTGGSDSYFYTDKTTVACSTSATFATYLSGTPWNFCTGRYQVDFDTQFGNSGAAGTTCVIFVVDGTTIGTCYLNGGQSTGWVSSASLSRDITISSSGCHCLMIQFARGGNTSCMTYGMIRAKRIC